jgi:hypothetical protein
VLTYSVIASSLHSESSSREPSFEELGSPRKIFLIKLSLNSPPFLSFYRSTCTSRSFLAYFPKVHLCDLHPARQRGLLFEERRDRPFSVGALTVEQRTSSSSLSDGRSVKFLLAFPSIIILDFGLLEIHEKDFYSLLDT